MGQTIVLNTLTSEVPEAVPGLPPQAVLGAGATGLTTIAGSHEGEVALRAVWCHAIVRTMYLSLACAAAAIPFACGMEWLNTKVVARQRRDEKVATEEPKRKSAQ